MTGHHVTHVHKFSMVTCGDRMIGRSRNMDVRDVAIAKFAGRNLSVCREDNGEMSQFWTAVVLLYMDLPS
jgi:hypothetical protein